MSPELEAWSHDTERFFTPIPEAIAEVHRRQRDPRLRAAVEEYLNGDIPEYFRNGPILYLSRHVATPNFETLRFIELAKPYGMPMVIGQDTEDIFVSHNSLKKTLGKMPIIRSMTHDGRELTEHFTIIHFDTAQGRKLKDITTTFGHNLVDFHNQLFRVVYPEHIAMIDDAAWIERNHRRDLVEHYKRMLALFLVHGVMFEYYPLEEELFVKHVLEPAFSFIEETFGYKPLLCYLVPPDIENGKDWVSYPSVVYKIVKNAVDSNRFWEDGMNY